MAKPFKRSHTANNAVLAQFGNERSSHWETPANGSSVHEVQITHNPSAFRDVPKEKNYLTPPYHWHWYQEEYFDIKSGRFLVNYEGKVIGYDKTAGRVTIPPGARHTFWPDPESAELCEMHISTQEEHNDGVSERFFRNLYSYLEDCARQGIAPSVPQLLLFLHSAETSLALPGPGFLSRWVSYAMGVVIGKWYGGYVLGLKDSYPEYYEENKGI